MTPPQIAPQEFRARLRDAAPALWAETAEMAERLVAPMLSRLDANRDRPSTPKTFNDPIWGTIELFPWEVLVLDSPLLQRLQGVRQLGMVHQVYNSAGHNRLEHTRGVVEAAERIIQALDRNAQRRRDYGTPEDRQTPPRPPSQFDRVSIRLAALLHDIGHGPFSHATEDLVGARMEGAEAFRAVLRTHFPDVIKIAAGELIAALVIMSDPLRRVFEHPNFGATDDPPRLAPAIVARMLGSREMLDAGYLSGVVSGPLDADKLDYMARDSYHAGLPVALDTNRLINKLEVVAVTPEAVTIPSLRRRAEGATGRRYYDVGISLAGLGAYEQMIVGRVILYDRLYYHHKVRAAEAMVRKLIQVAEEERGCPFRLRDLFFGISDEGMVDLFSGRLRADGFEGGGGRARALGQAILDRELYYRAFAVAKRFIGGVEGLPEATLDNTRVYRWNRLLGDLSDAETCRQVEKEIYERGIRILGAITDLKPTSGDFQPEHVALDVAFNKVVVRGSDILTRTEDGHLNTPNLFFDPERWSNAYKEQKQCGFVFAPRRWVPLVSLAARIVFYERFKLVMNSDADRVAKTAQMPFAEWVRRVADAGQCSLECREALTKQKPHFIPVHPDEIKLPADWLRENPTLPKTLAEGLAKCLPDGVLADVHEALIETINDLAVFVTSVETSGEYVKTETLDEKGEFQLRVLSCLRDRSVPVAEAEELSGGETDLRVRERLIVENKVMPSVVADPFARGPHYVWQARRYAMAICSNITFVVAAYKPSSSATILKMSDRIRVISPEKSPPGYAQIRVVIPFGHGLPHDAKAPS